ncbi:MAG: hypothetical protein MUC87_00985 [Bacteroidia bacterium]|jgi:hypothetical protein|nr:hypothetical protein [Bacteroidia bacterium]
MFKIKENIHIDFVPDKQLPCTPKLILNDTTVILTNSISNIEFQNELSNTKGSTGDWLGLNGIDNFGFNKQTNLLQVLCLKYPEVNRIPANIDLIRNCEKILAVPLLPEPSVDFEINPFEKRNYSIENNMLICFSNDFTVNSRLVEMKIAKDVSLIFENNIYSAWILYNPELYIDDGLDRKNSYESSLFLKTSLNRIFDLITIETVDKMDDRDMNTLVKISELYNAINQHKETDKIIGLSIMRQWLYDIVDKFYPSTDIQKHFIKN